MDVFTNKLENLDVGVISSCTTRVNEFEIAGNLYFGFRFTGKPSRHKHNQCVDICLRLGQGRKITNYELLQTIIRNYTARLGARIDSVHFRFPGRSFTSRHFV